MAVNRRVVEMPAKKAKSKAKTKKKAAAGKSSGKKPKTKMKTKTKSKAKTKTKAKAGAKARPAATKKPKTKAKARVKTATKKTAAKAGSKAKAGAKLKPAKKKAAPKLTASTPTKGKKLSKKELEIARARILAERRRIIMELGRIEETINDATQEKEGSNQSYSNHLADIGTDYMEQEKNFYYASQEGHYLRALDEALERIDRGTYGICEICTLRIGTARLEAVPSARQCIKCKSESEKGNRGR
jgi:DnaK suppressor protein